MVQNILQDWLLAIVDRRSDSMEMAQSRSVLVVVIVYVKDAHRCSRQTNMDKNKPLASPVASGIGWTPEPRDRKTRLSGQRIRDRQLVKDS